MPKITKEQEKRFHELEEQAVDNFLESMNFDVIDNLEGDDIEEYTKLKNLYFYQSEE